MHACSSPSVRLSRSTKHHTRTYDRANCCHCIGKQDVVGTREERVDNRLAHLPSYVCIQHRVLISTSRIRKIIVSARPSDVAFFACIPHLAACDCTLCTSCHLCLFLSLRQTDRQTVPSLHITDSPLSLSLSVSFCPS